MANTLTFIVQSAFETLQSEVEWVLVKTPDGSLVIGPEHQRLITIVRDGDSVTYNEQGVEKTISVTNGVLHAYPDKAVLLIG